MVRMTERGRFALVYDREARRHLQAIDRRFYGLIRAAIETHLSFEPNSETRNRKPLRGPIDLEAEWELRFGPDNRFRVFYVVDVTSREVQILAIGVKVGSRLFIGGEEIEL